MQNQFQRELGELVAEFLPSSPESTVSVCSFSDEK